MHINYQEHIDHKEEIDFYQEGSYLSRMRRIGKVGRPVFIK